MKTSIRFSLASVVALSFVSSGDVMAQKFLINNNDPAMQAVVNTVKNAPRRTPQIPARPNSPCEDVGRYWNVANTALNTCLDRVNPPAGSPYAQFNSMNPAQIAQTYRNQNGQQILDIIDPQQQRWCDQNYSAYTTA